MDRRRLIEKFVAAIGASDEAILLSLFAEDATLTTDGGGKVTAARKVILGRNKIVRLYSHLGRELKGLLNIGIMLINGELSVVSTVFGQPFAATVFETDGEQISAVYQVMNPDKLRGFIE